MCCAIWCSKLRRTSPPAAGSQALPELLRGARLGKRIAKLDMPMRRELLDLFVKSAGDYLDAWFESAPIKAAYGFDGIVGNYASPYAAGSAYVLLHHVFGEVNGKKGAWGHAIGGMGAITQAMAKAAAERGVDIRVASPVREVIVEAGRAVGVVTENGEADPRAQRRLESESEAAVRIADRPCGVCRRIFASASPLALRLRHLPHERRAVGVARLQGACRAARSPSITPPASSWRRASPTWTRPISMPRPADGRSAPSSKC